jgi:hypothetical protein
MAAVSHCLAWVLLAVPAFQNRKAHAINRSLPVAWVEWRALAEPLFCMISISRLSCFVECRKIGLARYALDYRNAVVIFPACGMRMSLSLLSASEKSHSLGAVSKKSLEANLFVRLLGGFQKRKGNEIFNQFHFA